MMNMLAWEKIEEIQQQVYPMDDGQTVGHVLDRFAVQTEDLNEILAMAIEYRKLAVMILGERVIEEHDTAHVIGRVRARVVEGDRAQRDARNISEAVGARDRVWIDVLAGLMLTRADAENDPRRFAEIITSVMARS